MLKSVCAAAALLLSFTPALAANPSQDGKDQVAAPAAQIQDQAKAAQSPEQAVDDDIQVIIMGKGMQVQVPNPYKNPGPRMITDAWAMRA